MPRHSTPGKQAKQQRKSGKQKRADKVLKAVAREEEEHGAGNGQHAGSRGHVRRLDRMAGSGKKEWRKAVQRETLAAIASGGVAPRRAIEEAAAACRVVDLAKGVQQAAHAVRGGGHSGAGAGAGGGSGAGGDSAATAATATPLGGIPPEQCGVFVTNEDCCDCAVRLAGDLAPHDPPVCVLNMASHRNPGGGYKNGAQAQEEYLCRTTTLATCVEGARRRYPLPSYGGLYCPRVTIFRHPEGQAYRTRATPVDVSMVCCAAVNRPETERVPSRVVEEAEGAGGADGAEGANGSGGSGSGGDAGAAGDATGHLVPYRIAPGQQYDVRLVAREEVEVRRRIVAMLQLCRMHGHVDLVLGAWGCGAFRNPPRHVAQVFAQVLHSKAFAGVFRRVVFAVWDPPGSRLPNFKPFARVIGAAVKRHAAKAGRGPRRGRHGGARRGTAGSQPVCASGASGACAAPSPSHATASGQAETGGGVPVAASVLPPAVSLAVALAVAPRADTGTGTASGTGTGTGHAAAASATPLFMVQATAAALPVGSVCQQRPGHLLM